MADLVERSGAYKWAVLQRLQVIEILAFYTGAVQNSDLVRLFNISSQQATETIREYRAQAPQNLTYVPRLKAYVPTDVFREVLTQLDPASVLEVLSRGVLCEQSGEENPYGVPVSRLPLPARYPPRGTLAAIGRAIRHQLPLQIHYYSLSKEGGTDKRIIEPHTLVDTGERWHVRAWDQRRSAYVDFVLSRISRAKLLREPGTDPEPGASWHGVENDESWNTTLKLRLAPHPRLGERQRLALSLDYGMRKEQLVLKVRASLAGYMLQRLRIDATEGAQLNPNAHQLVLINREEVEPWAGWALRR